MGDDGGVVSRVFRLLRAAAQDPKQRRRALLALTLTLVLTSFARRNSSANRLEASASTPAAAAAATAATASAAAAAAAGAGARRQRVPFSEFLRKVELDQVVDVKIGQEVIEFAVKTAALPAPADAVVLFTEPVLKHPGLVEFLHDRQVPFDELRRAVSASAGAEGWSARPVFMVLVPVVYFSLVAYVIKVLYDQTTGGDVGKRTSGRSQTSSGLAVKRTTFADVGGVNAAREVVQEVADFLKNPERYAKVGARLPTGVLLVGPPGTGKTMLARAMANECGLPFFHCSGSDFVEVYAGRGASRVRNLFAKAGRAAPCVLFVDEIDALGKSRSADFSMNEEREQTLNQLLACMDGFSSEKRVVVMAATNRYDVLDKALVRPGRFDRIIKVDVPDQQGREEVLRVHTRHMALSHDCDLPLLATLCPGYTGAELAMIANEAAIRAARDERMELLTDDFVAALRAHKDGVAAGKRAGAASKGGDIMGQLFGGLN